MSLAVSQVCSPYLGVPAAATDVVAAVAVVVVVAAEPVEPVTVAAAAEEIADVVRVADGQELSEEAFQ